MNGEQAEHPELDGEVTVVVADKAVVEETKVENPVIDAETQKALDDFMAQNKQDEAPAVHMAPAGAETVEAKKEREKHETVAEADLPANYTVRHTVTSFAEAYNCGTVEAQNVLNWLARINEAKRVKHEKKTGVGKGKIATVFSLPSKLEFGLEL